MAPEIDIEEEGQDWHKRDGHYHRIFTVECLPPTVPYGWIRELSHCSGVHAVAVRITPVDQTQSVHRANRFYMTQLLKTGLRKGRSMITTTREGVLRKLGKEVTQSINGEKVFNVAVYIDVGSKTQDGLDDYSDQLQRRGEKIGVTLTPITYRQDEAVRAIKSGEKNPLNISVQMKKSAIAASGWIYERPPDSRP